MLQFTAKIKTYDASFIMTPYKYSVSTTRNTQKISRDLESPSSIILPTPSGGLSLNESGNWDETEGFLDFSSGVIGTMAKKLKESGGTVAAHTIKGEFINDYASLSYSGSNFRTFSFSWDLIPSSMNEAIELSNIIKEIRKKSLPTYSGRLINYPSMWKVRPCKNATIGFFLLDCVISNFTVNFTPEGVLKMFESGHPTSISLELEFKELYRASASDVL